MNFWETVVSGEYVMFALALFLIITIILWWVKSARLYSWNKKNAGLMARIRDYVMEGDLENALHLSLAIPTPGARIISIGLKYLGSSMSDISQALRKQIDDEQPTLTRGLHWLRCIAIISPLIGAAGTLAGIAHRLADIGLMEEGADLALLSSQIAPTLITTIAGLGVGIVAIVAYICLEGTVEKSKRALIALANEFTDLLNEPS